jgi:hypothetical protein
MSDYATVQDVINLWRDLTPAEDDRVSKLLPIISDELRYRATLVGRDLDEMIVKTPSLASVAKEVTVSAISRILRQATSGEIMSQESQSGLGYSWSGTYAIPGGGIGNAILPSDLKRLGLKRGRIGIIDFYDPRNDSNIVE